MKALDAAFVYEEEVVVEEFIQGTEYTVAVVDGKAYPVVQIVPCQGFYDYENKYKPGAVKETCPAPISSELTRRLQDYAVQGYRALGLESYARLDLLLQMMKNLLSGSKYTSGNDSYQSDPSGGSSSWHGLSYVM